MNKYYKLCGSFLILFFLCAAVSFAQVPLSKKRIGVFLWNNDQRYLDGWDALREELKKEGFAEPDVEFIVEFAGGNKARAVEIAQKFAKDDLDMCISFGTTGTQVLMKTIKDVPIVFTIVYDPVNTGIAESWETSGNNLAGASNFVPMAKIIGLLRQVVPVENIAVFYTTAESNSVAQLKDLQKLESEYPVKIIPVLAKTVEDVVLALPYAIEKSDAIYITGSNVSKDTVGQIAEAANKAGKITVSHLTDYVPAGVTLGVGADFKEVSRKAASKAIMVLRGAKPISIPISMADKLDVAVNMKSARSAGIEIPLEFIKSTSARLIE